MLSLERSRALTESVAETLARSGNCAQTSFAVLQGEYGLDGAAILKALTPFPGLALRGETCGAVTGCLMAIGATYGRTDLEDRKRFLRCLSPARAFCRRFEEAVGSTACADILKLRLGRRFNLANSRESLEYLAAGGPQACSLVVATAVEIAADILGENRAAAVPQRPVSHHGRRRLRLFGLLAKAYVGVSRLLFGTESRVDAEQRRQGPS